MVKTVIGTYNNNLGDFFGISDIDGDGQADIIWRDPNWQSNAYNQITKRPKFNYWYLNNGVKTSEASVDDTTGFNGLIVHSRPLFMGDFNNDGNPTVVNLVGSIASPSNFLSGISWSNNNPVSNIGPGIHKVGDMDGDGDDDIVRFNDGDQGLYLWGMQDNKIVSNHLIGNVALGLSSGLSFVDVGDIDGDNDEDIIFRNSNDGKVFGWELENGSYVGDFDLGTYPNATAIGAEDFNGDGVDEIIFRDHSNEVYSLEIEMKGIRTGYSNISPGGVPSYVELVSSGDFDGDGDDDILWQYDNGQVHVWEVENYARIGYHNIHSPVGADWNLISSGDFDGDGDDDILWQHDNGQAHVWEIENNVRVTGYNILAPLGSDIELIGAGDFNGDGDDDLLAQNSAGLVIGVDMENGLPSSGFSAYPIYSSPIGAEWNLVDAGDFDGDGDDDILWQKNDGQVHVWNIEDRLHESSYDLQTPVGSDWTLKGAGDFNNDDIDDVLWQRNSDGLVHTWHIGVQGTLV